MQISAGIAFASGLPLALGLGCGQSHGSERRAPSASDGRRLAERGGQPRLERGRESRCYFDGRYLQDWANPLAAQGIATHGALTFPVGAVIVKEKYAGPHVAQADLVAIALMIKRGSGFDPAHGDWDYAYYEPALGIVQSTAQTTYCASCHAAAATDFVFVDGLRPE